MKEITVVFVTEDGYTDNDVEDLIKEDMAEPFFMLNYVRSYKVLDVKEHSVARV